MKLFGCKEKLADCYRQLAPADGYESSLELCAGTAVFSRRVSVASEKVAVEKDPGQAALLRVIKDNPVGLIEAMDKINYCPEIFDDAVTIREQGYQGYSDLEKAVAKKVLIEFSYNSTGVSFRDVDKGDTLEDLTRARKFKSSIRNSNMPSILSDSIGLQGINIVEDDMFNYLDKLGDESTWCFIDSPYLWSLRSSKKGYDIEWSNELHEELLNQLQALYHNDRLKSKVMICCYVDMGDLKNDMYCQALMKIGFKLVVVAKVYRPRIIKANTKKRIKPEVMECVFINYDPIVEDDMKTFTYSEIFGGDDIERDSSHQR